MRNLFVLIFIISCFCGQAKNYSKIVVQKSENKLAKSNLDVVVMKNGNIVKGIIINDIPSVGIKLKIIDGTVIEYSYSEILGFSKSRETFDVGTHLQPKEAMKENDSKKVKPKIDATDTLIKSAAKRAIADDVYSETSKPIKERSKASNQSELGNKKLNIFALGMGIHPSGSSYSLICGSVRKWGWFAKFKTNLNFDESYVDEGASSSARYFDSNTYRGRFAVTGGLLLRIAKPIIFYGGAGYGSRWVNWETISGDRFRVTDISYKGAECEAGLMLKLKKLVVSGGISSTSFKYMEANVGIGFAF